MKRVVVILEWDEKDLGDKWMNKDNLELCLYSKEHTNKNLLHIVQYLEEE